jgi:hypothetical protein
MHGTSLVLPMAELGRGSPITLRRLEQEVAQRCQEMNMMASGLRHSMASDPIARHSTQAIVASINILPVQTDGWVSCLCNDCIGPQPSSSWAPCRPYLGQVSQV